MWNGDQIDWDAAAARKEKTPPIANVARESAVRVFKATEFNAAK